MNSPLVIWVVFPSFKIAPEKYSSSSVSVSIQHTEFLGISIEIKYVLELD